jgi:hypothetical protein
VFLTDRQWVQNMLLFSSIVPLFARDRLHTDVSQENEKKLALSFNSTFLYIDDVILLNKFGDAVD